MLQPRDTRELMNLLQAANRLRTSLTQIAETMEPLSVLLEERRQGALRRSATVARTLELSERAWTNDRALAPKTGQELVTRTATLRHPHPDFEFPPLSSAIWVSR